MAKMNHLLLYGTYEKAFKSFSDEQVGRLIRSMLHYLNTGEEIEPKGQEKFVWSLVLDQLQRNMEKYEAICEENQRKSRKYWAQQKGAPAGDGDEDDEDQA